MHSGLHSFIIWSYFETVKSCLIILSDKKKAGKPLNPLDLLAFHAFIALLELLELLDFLELLEQDKTL